MTLNKLKKHQDKIPYEMLSKETLQSLRNPNALAIWVYLSSKPDELNVLKGHLQSHFSLSDVDYKKAIDELKQLGLFSIETVLNEENGEVTNQINVYPFITNKMEKSSVPGVHSHVIEKLVTNVQNSEEKTFIKSSQKTHPKPKEVAAFILETRLQANATNAKHFANEFIRFADAVGWSNDWRSQVKQFIFKATQPVSQPQADLQPADEFDAQLIAYLDTTPRPLRNNMQLSSLRNRINTVARKWNVSIGDVFEYMISNRYDNIQADWSNPFEKPEQKQLVQVFEAPTIEQVAAYCNDWNLAENFVLHYQSVNWMNGRTKITDWQPLVAKWAKNEYRKNQSSTIKSNKAVDDIFTDKPIFDV